jgi:hypothetical protein
MIPVTWVPLINTGNTESCLTLLAFGTVKACKPNLTGRDYERMLCTSFFTTKL